MILRMIRSVGGGSRGLFGDKSPLQSLTGKRRVPHPSAHLVFSHMTSFTHCPGTSFTLPRVRSTHRGGKSDGMEDDGCSRATRPVCDCGHAKNAVLQRALQRL